MVSFNLNPNMYVFACCFSIHIPTQIALHNERIFIYLFFNLYCDMFFIMLRLNEKAPTENHFIICDNCCMAFVS